MGCTPSIHVNQTGVVTYCRDSDDSNSPGTSYSAYHSHIVRTGETIAEGNSSGSRGPSKGKGKKGQGLDTTGIGIIEAETQTSRLHMKSFTIFGKLFDVRPFPIKFYRNLLPKNDRGGGLWPVEREHGLRIMVWSYLRLPEMKLLCWSG